jgi:hypothetical protein
VVERTCLESVLLAPAMVLAATGGDARAAEPSQAAAASSDAPDESRWYGWQTLLADGAAVGTVIAAFSAEANRGGSTSFYVASASAYSLAAPMVHLFHRRPLVALEDVGIRLGAPAVLALVGYGLGQGDHASFTPPGALEGIALGAVGVVSAIVFDAAWLASEPVAQDGAPATTSRISWSPSLSVTTRGPSLGIAGSF